MPAGVCLSPFFTDNTFSRDRDDIGVAINAVSNLSDLMEEEKVVLVSTNSLSEFVDKENIEWGNDQPYPEIIDLSIHLGNLILSRYCVIIPIINPDHSEKHPLPPGCSSSTLSGIWSEELGALYDLHEKYREPNEPPFIGIPCPVAFSGGSTSEYDVSASKRRFPLVDPNSINRLSDFYVWDLPDLKELHATTISIVDIKRNYRIIGGKAFREPNGGSHGQVIMDNGRTWPLDYNYDPCLEIYLRELAVIAKLPFLVTKFALKYGRIPDRKYKIEDLN